MCYSHGMAIKVGVAKRVRRGRGQGHRYTNEQKGIIATDILNRQLTEALINTGMADRHTRLDSARRAFIKICGDVVRDPSKHGIDNRTAVLIANKINLEIAPDYHLDVAKMNLQLNGIKEEKVIAAKEKQDDISNTVLNVRDMTWSILDKKLSRLMMNDAAIDKLNLGTLGFFAGIMFDKGRLVQGKATQHIALQAKIAKDLTAEQALELALKQQEIIVENKTR